MTTTKTRQLSGIESGVLEIISGAVGIRVLDMMPTDNVNVIVVPIPCYPIERVREEIRSKYRKLGWDVDYTTDKENVVLTRIGARD